MPDINFAQVVVAFLVLLFSLTVHEAAHAWAADWLGDSTARQLGRMSLNPLVHIDPWGTVVFPLIAIVTHLPIIGWAKPVPIDVLRLRHYRHDTMVISAAGPAANLVLAALSAVAYHVMPFEAIAAARPALVAPLFEVMGQLISINVLLAIFNLLPIPPLDGAGVAAGLLPRRAAEALDIVRPYGFLVLYALMLTGVFRMLVIPPYTLILKWLL